MIRCLKVGSSASFGDSLVTSLVNNYHLRPTSLDLNYDGCVTIEETLKPAVQIATNEAWQPSNSKLFQMLFLQGNIEVPWIIRNKTSVNVELTQEVISEIEKLKSSVAQRTPANDTAKFQKEVASEIFGRMIPHEAIDAQKIHPLDAVWLYYAYAKKAGLNVSFVLVEEDFMKMATGHVALTINTGIEKIVADPAYKAFDIEHRRTVDISPTQALSQYYSQRALKTPRGEYETNLNYNKRLDALLNKSIELDASNTRAKAMKIMIANGGDDPLRPLRDLTNNRIAIARRNINSSSIHRK